MISPYTHGITSWRSGLYTVALVCLPSSNVHPALLCRSLTNIPVFQYGFSLQIYMRFSLILQFVVVGVVGVVVVGGGEVLLASVLSHQLGLPSTGGVFSSH